MKRREPSQTMHTLPLFRCEGRVALPHSVLSLRVEDPKEIYVIENMMRSTSFSRDIVILTKIPNKKTKHRRDTPEAKGTTPKIDLHTLGDLDCYEVGCIARVSRVARITSVTLGGIVVYDVTVTCKQRARVSAVTSSDPFYVVKVTPLRTVGEADAGLGPDDLSTVHDTLRRISSDWLYQFAQRNPNDTRTRTIKEVLNSRHLLSDEALGWIMLSFCNLPVEEVQSILECDGLLERQKSILSAVQTEMESHALEDDVASKVKEDLQVTRRRLLLEQQLKVIKGELSNLKREKTAKGEEGDDDGSEDDDTDTAKLEAKLNACSLPPESAKLVKSELRRLKKMNPSQMEYGMLRSYLETVADLPWSSASEDCDDMKVAENQLNADHCGLDKVKRRILEFLAVRQMKVKSGGHSPILCLAGPPGVGKTSLGKSIAAALGRKFCRVALGGVSDEAEIRGHRRTYVASFPGRIMTSLKRAGTNNPVMLLDEIDKLGVGIRGDPSAALLEVLDPEQNCTFTDTYLGLPFDLSNVLFIATANSLSTISAPLLDRMEVLQLEGYTLEEKLGIAEQHLVPRQIARHGLRPQQLTVTKEALQAIVRFYTREAGVRNLEKHVSQLCRHVVTKVVSASSEKSLEPTVVDEPDLKAILGNPPHRPESGFAQADLMPCGVATGLAWTPTGGEVLFVEASTMPGTGKVQLTGQLGEVMQESVHCAVSWIRANATALFLSPKPLDDLDLHVHVPSGAVQKDGPSAGVAMIAALYSILSHTPLPHNIAMTGEITLTGRVTAVGGIRDKLLAAYRCGMRTVILPAANMSDAEELPPAVKEALTIAFVDDVTGAIAVLFKPEDIQSRMRNFGEHTNFRGSKL